MEVLYTLSIKKDLEKYKYWKLYYGQKLPPLLYELLLKLIDTSELMSVIKIKLTHKIPLRSDEVLELVKKINELISGIKYLVDNFADEKSKTEAKKRITAIKEDIDMNARLVGKKEIAENIYFKAQEIVSLLDDSFESIITKLVWFPQLYYKPFYQDFSSRIAGLMIPPFTKEELEKMREERVSSRELKELFEEE